MRNRPLKHAIIAAERHRRDVFARQFLRGTITMAPKSAIVWGVLASSDRIGAEGDIDWTTDIFALFNLKSPPEMEPLTFIDYRIKIVPLLHREKRRNNPPNAPLLVYQNKF